MRLYIIRHGDPDYPNNTITSQGHLEAQALAKRLEKEGINKICSSPLGRALDTMKYTADMLGIEPVIEDWTREHSNMWVNLENSRRVVAFNLDGDLIRNDLSLLNYEDWHKIPQFADLELRRVYENVSSGSDDFLKRHGYERVGGKYRCTAPNNDRIAVFCHGGFGLTWLAHLLEIPLPLVWSGFWLPTTSVTTILFDERSKGWAVPRCIGLGDVSHLYQAGLPVLPRGIVANFD